MKMIFCSCSVFIFLFAATALANERAGTYTLNVNLPIGNDPVGPATLDLTGTGAQIMYRQMKQVTEYPDPNGQENVRAGDGIVCHMQKVTYETHCMIEIANLSKGQLGHD